MTLGIAIVGNGEIGSAEAAAIFDADCVIRFNDCRSFSFAPGRTDIVAVCNTGRPAKSMLGSTEWSGHPAIMEAGEIWSVRDPEKFAALRTTLAVSHPDLDDFCDDYTAEFTVFCTQNGKTHVVIERRVHDAIETSLAAYEPPPYVVPSSGMIVIGAVMEKYPDAEVMLAGFGHVGWEWHPFAAEKQLVDSYFAAGRLKRSAETPLVSFSQGAR